MKRLGRRVIEFPINSVDFIIPDKFSQQLGLSLSRSTRE
jgi:hypothetical protein